MTQRAARFPTRPVAQLLGSNGPVHALAYSASPGTYILTGSSDRSIRLYKPSSTISNPPANSHSITARSSAAPNSGPQPIPAGKLIQTYASHAYEVLSLSVSHDNARFASSGGDRAVLLWDVSTAQTLRRFGSASTSHSHTGRVNCVSLGGSEDQLVISGGLDCTVRIWDVRSASNSSKPIQVLGEAKDAVTALAVSPASAGGGGGAEILAGSVDGRVRSYDVRMGRCVTDVFPASVTSVWLARDARTVLVGTLDSRIRLMDRATGACLRTYADERWRNTELRVQSVLGGGERFVVAGDEMTAASAAASAAAAAAAAGGGTGGEASTLREGEGGGAGGNEGMVWAWDLMTGRLVAKLPVPWGNGSETRKKVIGRDGKEKERKNVVSCIAWRDGGFGDQFCVGGTSGVVTVFGED